MPRRSFIIFVIFLCFEAALIAYVDRPLSEWVRTLDPKITDFFAVWTDLGKSQWYLLAVGARHSCLCRACTKNILEKILARSLPQGW